MPLRRWPGNVYAPALLVGAVLPDLPFFVLTVAGAIYYRVLAPPPPGGSIMEYLHFTLFYTHPLWIASHNFFHSLVIDSTLLLVGLWWWKRRTSRWGMMLFWLALSMILHVTIDLFTHHGDGPMVWLPGLCPRSSTRSPPPEAIPPLTQRDRPRGSSLSLMFVTTGWSERSYLSEQLLFRDSGD